MRDVSDIFKELNSMCFSDDIGYSEMEEAREWCKDNGFDRDHPWRPELVDSFESGFLLGVNNHKDLIESLKETLAELEALMDQKPPYTGGKNIANRARLALSKFSSS